MDYFKTKSAFGWRRILLTLFYTVTYNQKNSFFLVCFMEFQQGFDGICVLHLQLSVIT